MLNCLRSLDLSNGSIDRLLKIMLIHLSLRQLNLTRTRIEELRNQQLINLIFKAHFCWIYFRGDLSID